MSTPNTPSKPVAQQMIEPILNLFPNLNALQIEQFHQLVDAYQAWNQKINLISRKDMPYLVRHHLLHSLLVAQHIAFLPGTKLLDLGTGGGLPGLPLAILFPQAHFVLLDSRKKKIEAVTQLAHQAQIKNISTVWERAEAHEGTYDFILGRAVTQLPRFCGWCEKKLRQPSKHTQPNGILYLLGNFSPDQIPAGWVGHQVISLSKWLPKEPYFEHKQLVHLVKTPD